jgi:hypothetical protein
MKKWRPNIFVLAFILGAIVLTVLPLLQRRFLKAPEPVVGLPAWSLLTADGGVSSDDLRGHVYLASFVPPGCEEGCRTRQELFGHAVGHVADLDGGVLLVSFVAGLPPACPRGWICAGGPGVEHVIESFHAGWNAWAHTDAGQTWEEFATLPGEALVDQDGRLRGFWKDDPEGRGNSINAARLLAEHGASVSH